MAWDSLGKITPTLQWQLWNAPVIGTETFKVVSTWNIPPFYRLRAYLGQFFATVDEVVISRKIYPYKDTGRVLDIPIPIDLKKSGEITRYIGVKLGSIGMGMYQYDWQIELFEYLDNGTSTN
jgi:hypothetical protein